jgi:hypothetical protein
MKISSHHTCLLLVLRRSRSANYTANQREEASPPLARS